MHICCYVITQSCPTDKELDNILKPFYEYNTEEEAEHCFTYDCATVGGRYGGLLKMACSYDDHKYNFDCLSFRSRAGRLFRSFLMEQIQCQITTYSIISDESFLVKYLGIYDGFIRVDGCKVRDISNFDEIASPNHGFCCVTEDGEEMARETWSSKEKKWIVDEEFDQKKLKILLDAREMNMFLTIVDLHR